MKKVVIGDTISLKKQVNTNNNEFRKGLEMRVIKIGELIELKSQCGKTLFTKQSSPCLKGYQFIKPPKH